MVVAVLLVAGGLAAWLQPWKPDIEPASVERMPFALSDKPSVAVLPFENMSDDPSRRPRHSPDRATLTLTPTMC
jgi:hypothetical protein